MKRLVSILLVLAVISTGCAHIPAGDMSQETDQVFSSSRNTIFDRIITVLEKNDITIYRKNPDKGSIIAMNLPKQNTTTKVKIFVNEIADNKTKVSITSLSSTALVKMETLIFENMNS